MKKLKTICSAIVALSVLALAGCDLEIPEKSYVYYGNTVTVMSGTATGDYGTSLTGYGCAMIGTWSLTTYIDNEEKTSDEERTGTTWWSSSWGDGKCTEQTISDGQTLKVVAKCETDGAQIFFETYGNSCYVSLNPSDGDAWGTGTTYSDKTYSAKTFAVGETLTFTATFHSGSESGSVEYKIKSYGGDEEDD
ncbi:MAG: hypothetical protein K6B43_07200 [Treponema sp.]|nr:hypothetical protein [Treponema sp.]